MGVYVIRSGWLFSNLRLWIRIVLAYCIAMTFISLKVFFVDVLEILNVLRIDPWIECVLPREYRL